MPGVDGRGGPAALKRERWPRASRFPSTSWLSASSMKWVASLIEPGLRRGILRIEPQHLGVQGECAPCGGDRAGVPRGGRLARMRDWRRWRGRAGPVAAHDQSRTTLRCLRRRVTTSAMPAIAASRSGASVGAPLALRTGRAQRASGPAAAAGVGRSSKWASLRRCALSEWCCRVPIRARGGRVLVSPASAGSDGWSRRTAGP